MGTPKQKMWKLPILFLAVVTGWQILIFWKLENTRCVDKTNSAITYSDRLVKVEESEEPFKRVGQGKIKPRLPAKRRTQKQNRGPKFLTIFTTFTQDERTMFGIQNNTICNFAHFPENVTNLVVFVDGTSELHQQLFCSNMMCLNSTMCDVNPPIWNIIPLKKSLMSNDSKPILKAMFHEVQWYFNSEFYMYTDFDILFHTKELLQSLKTISEHINTTKIKEYLITGGRRNQKLYDPLKQNMEMFHSGNDDEIELKFRTAEKINTNNKEYFITGKNTFPWGSIPSFVVGEAYYADWLILYCNKLYIATFDITYTVMALHQEGEQITDKHTSMDQRNNTNAELFKKYITYPHNDNRSNLKCCTYRTMRRVNSLYVQKNPLFSTKNCILKGMRVP